MIKDEWQKFWEFSDEDVAKFDELLRIFKGKIVSIEVKKVEKTIDKGK